jgi:hypothetical protein
MEQKSARLFRRSTGGQPSNERSRNIVELNSRRQLRLTVHELIRYVNDPTLTTSDMREQLQHAAASFGSQLTIKLVRSLHHSDAQERQSVIWLLTLLNDDAAVGPLMRMSHNPQLPRAVRLSASLVLAGMGQSPAMIAAQNRQPRLYAIN